jgi:hypothetical protein
VGSCPVDGGNTGFSQKCHYSGYYNYSSSQVNRGPASIIDLLCTSSALKRVGGGLKPYIV